MQDEVSVAALREEVRGLRAELARYRRYLDDLLFNLEEENMPTVAEKIARLSCLTLLLDEGGKAVNGDALITALNAATGQIGGARLSLDGATAKNTYMNPVDKTSALRALCVDRNGKLYAVTG